MKNIFYTSIVVLSLCLISCKKKTETSSTGTGGNGGGGSTTGYYGFLEINSSQSVTSGTLSTNSSYATAFFSTSPKVVKDFSTYTKVNGVSLNGVFYKYTSWAYDYEDTTGTVPTIPSTWVVNGLSSIPSFSYTNNNPMPTFPNYALLPDTIYKNQTTNFNISGVTGADLVSVSISDASSHICAQSVSAGTATMSFSSSDLSTLSAGNSCYLVVTCSKDNSQTFSGKAFNFPIKYNLSKQISIK